MSTPHPQEGEASNVGTLAQTVFQIQNEALEQSRALTAEVLARLTDREMLERIYNLITLLPPPATEGARDPGETARHLTALIDGADDPETLAMLIALKDRLAEQSPELALHLASLDEITSFSSPAVHRLPCAGPDIR